MSKTVTAYRFARLSAAQSQRSRHAACKVIGRIYQPTLETPMSKHNMISMSVLFLLACSFVACKHSGGSSTESVHVTDGPSMTAPDRDSPSVSSTSRGSNVHPNVESFTPETASTANASGTTTAAKRPTHCLPVLTMGAAENSIALADTAPSAATTTTGLFSCDSAQAAAYYCADGSLRDLVGRCANEVH